MKLLESSVGSRKQLENSVESSELLAIMKHTWK